MCLVFGDLFNNMEFFLTISKFLSTHCNISGHYVIINASDSLTYIRRFYSKINGKHLFNVQGIHY